MTGMTSAQYRARVAEMREDARYRALQRQEAVSDELRREEAQAAMRAYYNEHGEWPTDTLHRQILMAGQREETERARREEQAAEKRQDDLARLQVQGYRPRSLGEIFSVALGARDA
jgi:hypothetical protein